MSSATARPLFVWEIKSPFNAIPIAVFDSEDGSAAFNIVVPQGDIFSDGHNVPFEETPLYFGHPL